MAELEREILVHYKLNSPNPTSWPEELDSDSSDDEVAAKLARQTASNKAQQFQRRKSQYSVLERRPDRRNGLVPNSQRMTDGVENLVQKDEPDPLGASDSVIKVLRARGIPVEDNRELRTYAIKSSS
jgi:exocyst complex component 2